MSANVLSFRDWEKIQEADNFTFSYPINEDWSLSDVLHTIGDVVSAASDCVWP